MGVGDWATSLNHSDRAGDVRIVGVIAGVRWLAVVAFFDDEKIMIGAERPDCRCHGRYVPIRRSDADFAVIQRLQNRLGELQRFPTRHGGTAEVRPEGGLHVFDDVKAAVGQPRK